MARTTRLSLITWLAALLAAFVLTGCAVFPASEGQTRDQVVAKYGKPGAEITRGGVTRLQYSGQPYGQFAWMVDLDSAGRVTQSFQALNFFTFSRIDLSGAAGRDDILWMLGHPASVDRVASWDGDVWAYRWNDGVDKFFWVYFDTAGAVRRTQQGLDLLNVPDRR